MGNAIVGFGIPDWGLGMGNENGDGGDREFGRSREA
jgi:hypothetical protein